MNDETEQHIKHINIDIAQMFPEAARRVRVLEELKRSWFSVVGPAFARHSRPCVLGVNTITVSVDSDNDIMNIRNVKGNIMRALSRYGCMTDNNFALIITKGRIKNFHS